MTALAPTLQAFFTERLAGQRGASPNTVAAYRDTFRLLLTFAAQRTGNPPSGLDIADLDAPLVAAFLDHLERDRHNSVRTRNNRLAAVHSLFGYAALRHPEHAASIQRVLAIGPGTVPASVDTGIGGSDLRENSKWVRHAPDLPRNTNNKQ
jgi:integrase/recombinase XerD